MSRSICQGMRKDGAPCKAPALSDSALCWVHDPRQAEAAARARAAGASKGGTLRALNGRRRRLDTAAALVTFTAAVVQDVLAGTVEPDVARAVLYGISIQRQLVEVAELERKLTDLERQYGTRRRVTR